MTDCDSNGKSKKKSALVIFFGVAFLVTGTGNTIISKSMYQTEAEGLHGDRHAFRKPWFANLAMFFGMMLCLVPYMYRYIFKGNTGAKYESNNKRKDATMQKKGDKSGDNKAEPLLDAYHDYSSDDVTIENGDQGVFTPYKKKLNDINEEDNRDSPVDSNDLDHSTPSTPMECLHGPGSEYRPLGESENETIEKKKKKKKKRYLPLWLAVAFPSAMDCLATFLMNSGLLFVDSSVYQIVRGSLVVFTGFIRWWFLGKPMTRAEIAGTVLIMAGLSLVGVAAVEVGMHVEKSELKQGDAGDRSQSSKSGGALIGIALIMAAQVLQASQTVAEEFLLSNVRGGGKVDPELIVGIEGAWGMILTGLVAMPLAQFVIPSSAGEGLYEDTFDSFQMLANSWTLVILTIAYTAIILGFNVFGMHLTDSGGSLLRNVFEPTRALLTWLSSLFLYYAISKTYGESWTHWSFLELAGFVILVTGLLVFNNLYPDALKPWLAPIHDHNESLLCVSNATPVKKPTQSITKDLEAGAIN